MQQLLQWSRCFVLNSWNEFQNARVCVMMPSPVDGRLAGETSRVYQLVTNAWNQRFHLSRNRWICVHRSNKLPVGLLIVECA